MLNLEAAELLKLKNNRLFLVATLLTLLIPADLVWMDAGRPQWWIEEIGLQTWFQASVQTTLMIVGPILSGFVLTQLIQQEYAERTIISMLTAPVPRASLLWGKLTVWLLWNIVVALETWAVLAVGSFIIFPEDAAMASVWYLGRLIVKSSLLSVWLILPLLAVCVWQRKLFYPSLLGTLFLTMLSTLSYQAWPVLPFMAVNILFSGEATEAYLLVGTISLTIWALAGLIAAFASFRRQAL